MLYIEDLHVSYGPVTAVRGLTLNVGHGEVVALLGPNGAGKTSTVAAVAGLTPAQGRIVFDGEDIARLDCEDRIAAGLAVCPEGRHVFSDLTVAENLRLGAHRQGKAAERSVGDMFTFFPRLRERRDQMAGTLSGGEQQMLALARAVVGKPKLLILDEPSLGLAPQIVAQIFDYINVLRRTGVTILLIEQSVTQALRAADRAYVMTTGRLRLSGRADEVANDPMLTDTYLGT